MFSNQKSTKPKTNPTDPFRQIVTNLENKSNCVYNPNKFSNDSKRSNTNTNSNNNNGILNKFSK